MDSVFYWTGAVALRGLAVLGAAWIWFLALRQLLRSVRETYLMADLVLWANRRQRRRRQREKARKQGEEVKP
jgi:hypothetical protein